MKEADQIFSEVSKFTCICYSVPHNYNPESLYNLENDYTLTKLFHPQKHLIDTVNLLTLQKWSAIYITNAKSLIDNNTFLFPLCVGYEMNKINSIDIDDVNDLEIAKALDKFIE